MTITVEATYENGIFKPAEPVTLPEGSQVRLTIVAADEEHDPLAGVIGICETGRTDGAEHHDRYLSTKRRP
ncbi:MAG: antitoxin family protein [Planctomycetes bacterium]|nr:antitoxin family protein [Planctomycetota bacterium]